MQTKNFLTKLLREMRPGVLPVTPKQSDRALNGLVRYHLGRRNRNSKNFYIRTMLIIVSDSQDVVHKQFVPEEERVNAEFYKE